MATTAVDMRGFVCWNPKLIDRVLDTEAMHVPAPLFLATHHPIKMYKETSQSSKGSKYDEEKFYSDFITQEEYIFAAVLGEAGTGKSHLIRWLSSKIQKSENRRVLLIPRSGTNLRRILNDILEGLEGSTFDEYRNRLKQATENMNPMKAREMFASQLAIAIGPTGKHELEQMSDEEEYFSEELHHLFHDPFFRHNLLRDGGIIHKLTDHVLGQNQETERLAERRQFTVEDLPLNLREIENASKLAREVYVELLGDEDLKQQAVDWINKKLNDAIIQMLNFQGADLITLMEDVRASLAELDTELVLLIEDFAVLQGIDLQLLDALLVKPRQIERRRLCNLRVALACTTGYFETLPNTVRSRIEFRVRLDVDTGSSLMSKEHVEQFVSRYLNVLRMSESDLDEWYNSFLDGTTGKEVPSACRMRECPHIEKCHGAFGNEAGRGLYPFNSDSIQVMYRRLFDTQNPQFNPRVMIKDVLKHVLANYTDHIIGGMFPSPALYDHFGGRTKNRLNTLVTENIKKKDVENASRREVLLELWSQNKDLDNLDSAVHEAFDLPLLQISRSETIEQPSDRTRDSEPLKPVKPPDEYEVREAPELDPNFKVLQENIEFLKKWSDGGELPQKLGQLIREPLYKSISANIDWNREFLIVAAMKKIWKPASIGFIRSNRINVKFDFKLPLPNDDIRGTSIALQALLQYKHFGHWKFDNAPEYYRYFTRFLHRWSEEVVKRLKEVRITTETAESWNPVPSAIELLTTAMVMQGDVGSNQSLSEQINGLFSNVRPVHPYRSTEWRKLQNDVGQSLIDTRGVLLERAICTKGSSRQYRIIDAAQIISPLRKVLREGSLTEVMPETEPAEYKSMIKAHRALSNDVVSVIEAERKQLSAWKERVINSLGENPQATEIVAELSNAMQKATEVGIWAGTDANVLKASAQRFKSAPILNTLLQVGLLQEERSVAEQLDRLGRLDLDTVQEVEKFVEDAESFLQKTSDRVERDLAVLQSDQAVQNLGQVKDQITASLEQLCSLLEEGNGGDEHDTHASARTASLS